jgi:hypothetical protein
MSVLMCNRGNCENIMCNRHSRTYGYICEECFEELKRSSLNFAAFMKTSKVEDIVEFWGEKCVEEFPLLWQEQIEEDKL